MDGVFSYQHFEDGAQVEKGQSIGEVELMKTFYSVEAPASGKVRYLVALGEMVAAGQALAEIETNGT